VIPDGDHQLRCAGADRLDGHIRQCVFGAQAEKGHDGFGCIGLQEIGLFLRHDDVLHLAMFGENFNGDHARFQFQRDDLVVSDEFQSPCLDQPVDCRDGWMPGEGDLFSGGEVASAEIRFVRLEDERGFGQVHLSGDGEHGVRIERVSVEDDRAGIPLQGLVGEGVNLEERKGRHGEIIPKENR